MPYNQTLHNQMPQMGICHNRVNVHGCIAHYRRAHKFKLRAWVPNVSADYVAGQMERVGGVLKGATHVFEAPHICSSW